MAAAVDVVIMLDKAGFVRLGVLSGICMLLCLRRNSDKRACKQDG